MGTTLVSAVFADDALIIGHVGDSRLYRLREGLFDQLTEDHSLLNDYIKMKNLTPEEIAAFPHKNVIVRALGMKDTRAGRRARRTAAAGRRLRAVLGRPVGHGDRHRHRRGWWPTSATSNKLCDRLIAMANGNGGLDNVTVVAIRVEPE